GFFAAFGGNRHSCGDRIEAFSIKTGDQVVPVHEFGFDFVAHVSEDFFCKGNRGTGWVPVIIQVRVGDFAGGPDPDDVTISSFGVFTAVTSAVATGCESQQGSS